LYGRVSGYGDNVVLGTGGVDFVGLNNEHMVAAKGND